MTEQRLAPELSLYAKVDGYTWNLDCGIVQSVDDRVQVNLSTTPIVTYDAENAFVFDTGATNTYTFKVIRKNPNPNTDGDLVPNSNWSLDETKEWSNRKWKEALTLFINRWQALSDGCVLNYTPVVQVGGEDVYQRSLTNLRGYLKSVIFEYSANSVETITANISFTLGSMCSRQRIQW